jgi:hypothetical protein
VKEENWQRPSESFANPRAQASSKLGWKQRRKSLPMLKIFTRDQQK